MEKDAYLYITKNEKFSDLCRSYVLCVFSTGAATFTPVHVCHIQFGLNIGLLLKKTD